MNISYKNNKLSKTVTSPKDILKNYGTRAKLVNQRIEELKAASTLEVMRTLPRANCHELSGNRKGEFAVDISANHRIIFEPNHNPVPQKEDGGINWAEITDITILAIGEDYH
ncbi:killer suppression protein HigA [Adhaeribacter arboris]|uniref:Killer suppression protein HigA n=1 Tax=Adhaeribacter arboris TaxID=2072846 RepID=A0A2T2Y8P8_9BACT|nr:killer suppression protein HigA [Adhaeribacter arboris]PSR51885.1 killer suppression protein HigA [Adhaeribacter arboris]